MKLSLIKPTPWPGVFWVIGGTVYRWNGWFGCQLESHEWFTVPAGTKRTLKITDNYSVTVTVFSTRRHWFTVRTTWTIPDGGSLDEYNARIHQLRNKLKELS